MKVIRLYMRVLEMLGRETRLAWVLALANVALAAATFVEPILFGRIVDTLANAQGRLGQLSWTDLMLLVGAWVGFGLFTIVCSTLVALHADRLSHRQYQVVRTMFFEHVLQLPLSFYTGSHSGRLVKVMITGTTTLWGLWLAFFREHFASLVSLIVLLPLTLFINWRYGLLLIALCAVFAGLIALVINRTEQLQSKVEGKYSEVGERTADTLGNIALVQSFARVEFGSVRDEKDGGGGAAGPNPCALMVGDGQRHHTQLDDAHHARNSRAWRVVLSGRPHHGRRDRDVHELCRASDHAA